MNQTTIGDIVRGDREIFPPYLYEAYQSTRRRAPTLPLIDVSLTVSELTGPGPAISAITSEDADLTCNAGTGGEAIGQRIIVTGRVLDDRGNPVSNTLLEIWQANAAGRYLHKRDQWPGPLDPNFLGMGRCLTNQDGVYRFLTIRPGAYPWKNHPNAWRPAHIHFSVFGPSMLSRLVTQMYFPDDQLHSIDPILNSVPTEAASKHLMTLFDWETTVCEQALGYRFDIILSGRESTPWEK